MSLDPANSKSGYSAHDTDKNNAYRNTHQEVGMNEGGGENSVEESQNSSEVQAGFHNTLDTNCAMNTGMECVALMMPIHNAVITARVASSWAVDCVSMR